MGSENSEDIRSDLKPLFEKYKKVQTDYALKNFSQQSGDTTYEVCNESIQQHFEIIINRIGEKLKLTDKAGDEFILLLSMNASIMYEQAKVKLANNSVNDSLQLLENALDEIKDFLNHKQINYIYLRIANHLSYIYAQKGELEKSRTILEEIVNGEDVPDIRIYSSEDLFHGNEVKSEEASIKLNKLKVNNMQMLAWVLGRLGLHDKHMLLQHEALQKQLDLCDGEPTAWVSRCCRLAALFQTQSLWVHARYHLAAASGVLQSIEPVDEQLSNNEQECIVKCRAELIRGWIHYGCHLFSYSKKAVLENLYFGETNPAGAAAPDDDIPIEEEPLPENYKFTGLDVIVPDVPAVKIVTTEQARALFMHTHTWLKQERLLYPLRDYPLQYVNAVLDLSELYRFLAFYEVDLDSQYNVQKRRADSLETLINILKDIRPSCYLSVSVELLRELTEVQIELMGINLKRLYLGEVIDDKSGEENIKRRIDAVCDIHSQLESLGNMMGNSVYEPEAEDEPNSLVAKKTEENINVSENEDKTEDGKIEDQQLTNENEIELP